METMKKYLIHSKTFFNFNNYSLQGSPFGFLEVFKEGRGIQGDLKVHKHIDWHIYCAISFKIPKLLYELFAMLLQDFLQKEFFTFLADSKFEIFIIYDSLHVWKFCVK